MLITWNWYNFYTRFKNQYERFKRMYATHKQREHWDWVNQCPATKPKGINHD